MPLFNLSRRPDVQRMKSDHDIDGLVEALQYQDDHNVRLAAASALGQVGDSRAVAPLITALEDRPRVREIAALALGEIGDPRAVSHLIDTLEDESWEGRSTVAKALGKIGDPRATRTLIKLLDDGRQNVRWNALQSLTAITGESFGEDVAAWKEFDQQTTANLSNE